LEAAAVQLLLDTHIWLLALDRPEKLSRPVQRQLQNPKNELYLSPISVWEAQVLVKRGRLRLKQSWPEWIEAAFARKSFIEATFSFAVVVEAGQIQLPQADLGDLFLAATRRR
jgi:PIN domain nuclease of toxin-antitoxin system